MKTQLGKAQIGKVVKTVAKTASKVKTTNPMKITKADMIEAFKRMERKDLKAKLQAFDKAGKKMQAGGYVPPNQPTGTPKAGGAILNKKSSTPSKGSISEKAAKRKVAKGKGTISYKMGDKTAPGSSENKGQYIGFSKQARKDYKSGKTIGVSMSDAKAPKSIKKMGGATKKMQGGGSMDPLGPNPGSCKSGKCTPPMGRSNRGMKSSFGKRKFRKLTR